MRFTYKKLWKLLIDRDMTRADLREATGVSPATFAKMSKGEPVGVGILDRILCLLDCLRVLYLVVCFRVLDLFDCLGVLYFVVSICSCGFCLLYSIIVLNCLVSFRCLDLVFE